MPPADGSPGLRPEAACAHCGEPVPTLALGMEGNARSYCCAGCAEAARWIESSGLGDYYRWRQAPASRIGGAEDFSAWDRPETLEAHTTQAPDGSREVRLAVGGMHCAACAWLIDKALRREHGVLDARANAIDGRAWVRWAPGDVLLSTLLGRLAALGYRPSLPASAAAEDARRRERRRRLVGLGIAGLGALQAMMFSEALYLDTTGSMPEATRDAFRWITAAISAPVVFIAGAPFLHGMVRELRLRVAGMDTLVGSGLLLAWGGSLVETFRGGPQVWFDAAVMFVLFLLAARHIEAALRASGQARLDALAGAQPAMAWREAGDRLEQVPARDLAVDDVVRVGSGEALPCDGVLLDTEAEVDEALLTGESTPRSRQAGEAVLAGGVVHGGTVRLKATAVGAATAVAQVARRVETLRDQRPPLADHAARLSRRVVAVALVVALAAGGAWWLLDPSRAFPIALAVLVATCPCALALAVPAALARAQGRLAARGVLVLSGDALQRLAAIDTVAFDKTGTLTRGQPRCVETTLFPAARAQGLDADAARGIAARLEAAVSHPLARAFGTAVGAPVDDARQAPGQGVSGRIDGAQWSLGRRRFALAEAPDEAKDDPGLWLARDGEAIARFLVEDRLREDAGQAVARLRAEGLALRLLSGDAQERVAALAHTLGLPGDDARGRLSPGEKLAQVRQWQAQGQRVLMVGDGINDADVLAAADASIAMAEGAALAQRQADLVLGGPALAAVPEALAIARQTRAVIRQNLVWAAAYNLVILPVAALGLIGPGLAALGMALSSLAVTANAWRIGRGRPEASA